MAIARKPCFFSSDIMGGLYRYSNISSERKHSCFSQKKGRFVLKRPFFFKEHLSRIGYLPNNSRHRSKLSTVPSARNIKASSRGRGKRSENTI